MNVVLPIDAVIAEIGAAIATSKSLVIEAPPGAGKTTRVPRALLNVAEIKGEIVVLEPRRLAAKMAARRVAEEMGERVGETVGFTVRFEEASSQKTRIRFVTEGVLLRRAHSDPTLSKIGAVVLDEFHERHVHGDVALALVSFLQSTSRPDLRVIVMSATLDAEPVRAFLGCESIRSEGRKYDVAIEHTEDVTPDRLHLHVTSAVRRATSSDDSGDVLVFLPGASEIRKAGETLEKLASERDLLVLPLYGELPIADQDRAVKPATKRKVILSTNVAESSLTIDGVGVVIDSGLVKRAGFAAWSGLPTLRIEKASRASLTQRAGRAGRTREGICIRLFTRADEQSRASHETPELLRVDLTQILLELAASGLPDVKWLDAPPAAALSRAHELLKILGAIDSKHSLTELGRNMARFPAHPRLSRVVIEAAKRNVTRDGCLAAALLGERDFFAKRGDFEASGRVATQRSDVMARIDAFRSVELSRFSGGSLRASELDAAAVMAVDRAYQQLCSVARPTEADRGSEDDVMISILAGFPDRVARRVRDRALALSGGGSAELSKTSLVRDAPLMVAASAEERSGTALVRIASAIEPEWLIDICAERITEERTLVFVAKNGRIEEIYRLGYDGLVLDESRKVAAPSERASAVLFEAAVAKGVREFVNDDSFDAIVSRIQFANTVDPSFPVMDENGVNEVLRELCEGRTSFAELRESSLLDALRARLGSHVGRLEKLAPSHVKLAVGRSVQVHYEPGKQPWIASRLQDFFGMKTTPRIGDGRVALVVHLLAPNQRALQVTSDLEGFWTKHYPDLRKQLSRRYPRHAWPENP